MDTDINLFVDGNNDRNTCGGDTMLQGGNDPSIRRQSASDMLGRKPLGNEAAAGQATTLIFSTPQRPQETFSGPIARRQRAQAFSRWVFWVFVN
jgi:hypothetical protein